MQIEIFTLCDNAQVYAGKAVVIGAFNQIKAQKLPVIMPSLTLAVRVVFEKSEAGGKTFYVEIKNPDGTLLIPELKCDTKQPEKNNEQDALITYDLNLVFGNIIFNQYGSYFVNMKYGDKLYQLKFYVIKT